MAPRSRTSRRKRRRDTPAVLPTTLGGLLVIALLGVLAWQALRVYNGVPGRAYTSLYVSTPEVGNLLTHDPVRVAGARVGQVADRDIGPDGAPRLELQIEPGTDLPVDTKVAVRGAGLLGARYVELIPGRSKDDLDDGALVKGDSGSFTYGLPEALNTFDKETQGRLGQMLGGLGQTTLARGEGLNDTLHAIATRGGKFGAFSREVLQRDGAAGRLVPALRSAVAPLDANRAKLSQVTRVAPDAIAPFIDRREQLRSVLDKAPPTFDAVQPGLAAGTRLLTSVRAAATQANVTLPPAPAGLRATTALLRDGRKPLEAVAPVLDAAQDAVPGALEITGAVQPILKPATGLVDTLHPMLGEVAKYGCDIVNFGETMRSMTGFTQPGSGANGPAEAFRLQLVLPTAADAVGVRDPSAADRREGVVTPCKYLSSPYPQFTGDGR